MTRILLFGSNGQLGTELVRMLGPREQFVALTRRQVDLQNEASVREAIRAHQPAVILNAAAYTAVDRAESEESAAFAVNAHSPAAMAAEAARRNAWLVHFSTDYVFDGSGTRPWREDDLPHPLNVYGRSKLAGEQAIAASRCNHLIFRTSWVYAAHGANFLRTMLRLAAQRPSLNIVDDQIGAPTSAKELARAITAILPQLEPGSLLSPQTGLYHMTCTGSTSWCGFAAAIFERVKHRTVVPAVVPIPTEQYPTPAARPRNSVLDCSKLARAFGVHLADWREALDEVLAELEVAPN